MNLSKKNHSKELKKKSAKIAALASGLSPVPFATKMSKANSIFERKLIKE
tara:strand:+ start:389 stop:538 length:150 start_codon:yes stop_codon:yes gene_type:complete